MKSYPLAGISIEEAKTLQFKWIEALSKNFDGHDFLCTGDLGLYPGLNKPRTTAKVEQAIADFFGLEKAILVRGAGTGALRFAFYAVKETWEEARKRSSKTFFDQPKLLIHKAPVYPTSKLSLDMLSMGCLEVNFNDENEVKRTLSYKKNLGAVLIQHTRQKIDDSYDPIALCALIKDIRPELPIIFDDNYAVLKVKNIGAQVGADMSCFSTFKLLGPEGIGCLVGKRKWLEKIESINYSGGSQVQGHEAMEVVRGFTYAPVALAIQGEVNEKLADQLNNGILSGVKRAFLANAQSKVLLVEFKEEIARDVLAAAPKYGAAPYPVGSESKYEILPMFYRISGTFRAADPELEKRMIRINPMRSGVETILRILRESMKEAKNVFK